jgi:Asp-tRNA(Asn)/Glu-tRNA(Gln) amidotransferase A subunit family amidase
LLESEVFQQLDGLAIAEGIRRRQFSATEVMDCALQLAEALNPQLNAITWQTFEQAREQALALDAAGPQVDQPFCGVPFLVKDNSAVRGLPQTSHSRLFEGEVATHDAPIVSAFSKAGLLSLGKANTPELCLTITTESAFAGPCHNPWNLNHSAGGSSGGSCAAVAARIVPLAHGSDGGGSIRIPASCCGLVGHKPSRGLTPSEPDLAGTWSGMSVGHVVTRSVRDSAAMLDAIRLQKPALYPLPEVPQSCLSALKEFRPLTIAIQRQHPLDAEIHPEVNRALEKTVEVLRQFGHDVRDAAPPVDYGQLSDLTGRIINLHVAQAILPQLQKCGETLETPLLEEATRRMAKRGGALSAIEYAEALDGIHRLERSMEYFHRRYDVLVSPVLTQPPAPLGWLDMNSDDMKTYVQRFGSYSGFCSLFNATGQPSLSVPVYQSDAGLPVGILLSAGWGADATLLQLAYSMENEIQWEQRRPPVALSQGSKTA